MCEMVNALARGMAICSRRGRRGKGRGEKGEGGREGMSHHPSALARGMAIWNRGGGREGRREPAFGNLDK